MERQEQARDAALKAFHDNIAQRAAVAGAVVVAGNKARQEREERLMAASEARAKAEAEVRMPCHAMPWWHRAKRRMQIVGNTVWAEATV